MVPATDSLRYPIRILCPTDFTPFSRRALEYAIALARPAGAEITLLHVLLLPLPSSDTDDEPDWMPPGPGQRSTLLEQMRRFAEPADAAGLPIRLVLREGIPADEILSRAASLETDLIVMGSHGRRGFERWILGSHAGRVLRLAPCPVLTVSGAGATAAEVPVQIREVLCAASGSAHAPQTVEYARCLAAGTRAHLTLLHVTVPGHPGGPRRRFRNGRIQAGQVSVVERTTWRSPRSEILRLAKKRGVDLIVIGNHDRGPAALGYLGSTSDRVVREAECAVLTVKATPRAAKRERSSREGAIAEAGRAAVGGA